MKCKTVSHLLALHVGGDLPPERGEEVELHLTECRSCRAECARYVRSRQNLFVLKGGSMPSSLDLWPAIREEIEASTAAVPSRRSRAPVRIALLAACLLGALGAGLTIAFHPISGTHAAGRSHGVTAKTSTSPARSTLSSQAASASVGGSSAASGGSSYLLREAAPVVHSSRTGSSFVPCPRVEPAPGGRESWDVF